MRASPRFGTGYGSMAYLARFPVDTLKIDRSFISGIAAAEGPVTTLVHTLIQLGKALGLETLVDGIETEDQSRQLQREQCDSGQGFLFARPLDAEAAGRLLAEGHPSGDPHPGLSGASAVVR